MVVLFSSDLKTCFSQSLKHTALNCSFLNKGSLLHVTVTFLKQIWSPLPDWLKMETEEEVTLVRPELLYFRGFVTLGHFQRSMKLYLITCV